MTPDTKSELRGVLGTVAIIGAALAAGILSAPAGKPKTITLAWDNAPGALVTGIESTTNFKTWRVVALVTNSSTATLPMTNGQEFFRAFHRVKWLSPDVWLYY